MTFCDVKQRGDADFSAPVTQADRVLPVGLGHVITRIEAAEAMEERSPFLAQLRH